LSALSSVVSRGHPNSTARAAKAPEFSRTSHTLWSGLFAGAFGFVLGLALLKFGNPVILDRLVERPGNMLELIFQPWPLRWGYVLLGLCCVTSIATVRFKTQAPAWMIGLPGLWFVWQMLASATTVDAALTRATLVHFGACAVCFYLGLFGLSRLKSLRLFWLFLLLAFAWALWTGFEQHYGGLEATRKMFFAQPNWQQSPPEYIKKIQSNRIFSTLVYPNALAAAVLLLLPPLLVATASLTTRLTNVTRAVLVGFLGYAALACLFWSGSKAGWLIALALMLTALLRQAFSRRIKLAIVGVVLALGLTGFFFKYAPYFHRGAPSVSARFEYWRAAGRTALAHPVFGTGPGTFSVAYRKIKPPGAEMAQLTHDDYLEQASDSGFAGLAFYCAFVLGSVALLGRRIWPTRQRELFAAWLGLLGWCLQSFVEFPLYIPGLAWPAFALFGWSWACVCQNESDGPDRSQVRKQTRTR
jgi:O-Antigen ligase